MVLLVCRISVSIEVFVTSIIDPPLGGSMRVAYNDSDDRAGLRGYVQLNKYTYIHAYIHTFIHTYIHT